MGWSIGGMDFSVLFGAAVTSRMIRYWNAVFMASIFCFLGAYFQGWRGIDTISHLTAQSLDTAIVSSVAAAMTIIILNLLRLPIPTSQAVVGSIVGISLMIGDFRAAALTKVVTCWMFVPVVSFMLAIPLYIGFGKLYNSFNFNLFQRNAFLRIGLIIVGCYASYALGANAVANVAAVFVGSGQMTAMTAALIGAGSILLGFATFSKGVVRTIGKGIVKLDSYSALVAVLCEAITTHLFAFIGVPVSMTQALVGAIIGIGIIRGYKSIRIRNLGQILLSWIFVPIVACILSAGIFFAIHLRYMGP